MPQATEASTAGGLKRAVAEKSLIKKQRIALHAPPPALSSNVPPPPPSLTQLLESAGFESRGEGPTGAALAGVMAGPSAERSMSGDCEISVAEPGAPARRHACQDRCIQDAVKMHPRRGHPMGW